jgi:hypothetical protein
VIYYLLGTQDTAIKELKILIDELIRLVAGCAATILAR